MMNYRTNYDEATFIKRFMLAVMSLTAVVLISNVKADDEKVVVDGYTIMEAEQILNASGCTIARKSSEMKCRGSLVGVKVATVLRYKALLGNYYINDSGNGLSSTGESYLNASRLPGTVWGRFSGNLKAIVSGKHEFVMINASNQPNLDKIAVAKNCKKGTGTSCDVLVFGELISGAITTSNGVVGVVYLELDGFEVLGEVSRANRAAQALYPVSKIASIAMRLKR